MVAPRLTWNPIILLKTFMGLYLPHIFYNIRVKTFELSKKSFTDQDFEQSREDIMKLVEITTFELEISNKKELRIKLFDWLASFEKVDFRLWLGY